MKDYCIICLIIKDLGKALDLTKITLWLNFKLKFIFYSIRAKKKGKNLISLMKAVLD